MSEKEPTDRILSALIRADAELEKAGSGDRIMTARTFLQEAWSALKAIPEPPRTIERDREAGAGLLLSLAELVISKQAKIVNVIDVGHGTVEVCLTITKSGRAYLPQILDEHRNDDDAHAKERNAQLRFTHAERLATKWTERLSEMSKALAGHRGEATFQSIEHNRKRLIQTVYAALVIAAPFKQRPSVQMIKAALEGTLIYFGVPTEPPKEIRSQVWQDHPEGAGAPSVSDIEAETPDVDTAWVLVSALVRRRWEANRERPKLDEGLAEGVATECRARMGERGYTIETQVQRAQPNPSSWDVVPFFNGRRLMPAIVLR